MSEELKNALETVLESGYQLSSDGFNYLKKIESFNLKDLVKKAIIKAEANEAFILDSDFLQSIHMEESNSVQKFVSPIVFSVKPFASEHESQIQVLNDFETKALGDLSGFVEHFRSRFNKIESILRKRIDMVDATNIRNTLKMPINSKLKVIGIVTNKRASRSRLFIDLEDEEESITVLASDRNIVQKGLSIIEDQVICVEALKYKPDLLIANDFIWPDVPSTPPKRSNVHLCAAFLSDVHIGSKYFRDDLFKKFIKWMNLEGGSQDYIQLASRVKYVIISGDLVDGIGVYPNQIYDLEITDIREQYEEAASILSDLPDHVEIIILPGNHDAVRKSLPQPPINMEYAKSLCDNKSIHLLGNPSRVLLNGVEVFINHGKALHDILGNIPGLDFQHPINGIELLLRCRHVAPKYGASTPIAPEIEDNLVIPSVPDIFQMGHIHIYGVKKFKGITLISTGSWQDQTPFQKKMNLYPTVGVAPIVDLQTHKVTKIDFNRFD